MFLSKILEFLIKIIFKFLIYLIIKNFFGYFIFLSFV